MKIDLDKYNPQWITQEIFTEKQTRLLFPEIISRLDTGLVTILTGPRRVGKSTLLKQTLNYILRVKKIKTTQTLFYEFEPKQSRNFFDDVVGRYFETKVDKNNTFYLFLDEIQFVSDYELSLKYLVDQFPQVKILMTGSLSLSYKRKMSESLAGRILPLQIYPLCFEEYLNLANLPGLRIFEESKKQPDLWSQAAKELNPEFQNFLTKKTYPQAIFWPDTVPLKDFLDTIINQSLNQDAMQFFNLDRPDLILNLYKYFAQNNGSEVSLATLASKTQSNIITIKKYLDVLELLGLVYILKNTLDPLKNINSKAKIFVNSIFENSWAGNDDGNLGSSVESYVLQQLLSKKRQISFFRDRNKEVDFLDHTTKEAVEVKYRFDIRNQNYAFLKFQAKKIEFTPVIITQTQTDLAGDSDLKFIPACFV